MTADDDVLDRLPPELQFEVIEDISHKGDKQSVIARKQRRAIEVLRTHTRQGERTDLREDETSTSNGEQVPRPRCSSTIEKVAKLYDEGGKTVERRVAVLKAAESDPEKWGRFLNEMDADGRPSRAYQRLCEAQRAENINRDRTPDLGQPIVRRGEIWRLGDHTLMCGDSTVAADVNRLLAGAAPHLMVTDPPYGVEFDSTWRANVLGRRRVPGSVPNDDRADWREAYALFPGHVAYVYCGKLTSDMVIAGLEAVGLERRDKIIWIKRQFVIGRGDYQSQYEEAWYAVRRGRDAHWHGGRDKSDVWMITRCQNGRDHRTIHGTQKPVECMLRPIENNSRHGEAVYDPFVGSGTTIIAAEIAGRRCYGMDIDPAYCTVAVERWQNYTGGQGVLEGTGQTFAEVKNERLRTFGNREAENEEKTN